MPFFYADDLEQEAQARGNLQITVGSTEIPMWASVLAVIGPSALAVWLWKEERG